MQAPEEGRLGFQWHLPSLLLMEEFRVGLILHEREQWTHLEQIKGQGGNIVQFTQVVPYSPHNCSYLTVLLVWLFVTVMSMAVVLLTKKISNFKSKRYLSTIDLCDCFSTATSSLITAQQQVTPGIYSFSLVVLDSEGRQCEALDDLTLEVCQCDYRDTCRATETGRTHGGESIVRLGPAAIGLIFLGLLLLLCEYAKVSFWFSCCVSICKGLHTAQAMQKNHSLIVL